MQEFYQSAYDGAHLTILLSFSNQDFYPLFNPGQILESLLTALRSSPKGSIPPQTLPIML